MKKSGIDSFDNRHPKYVINWEDSIEHNGHTLYRIYRKYYGRICDGGYVEGYHNLSQQGSCMLFSGKIYGKARVSGNAEIRYGSEICGSAEVSGSCRIDGGRISGSAKVYGNARINRDGDVRGHARIYDNTEVDGLVKGNAVVHGNSKILKKGIISGSADVSGSAKVSSRVYGSAKVYGDAGITSPTNSGEHYGHNPEYGKDLKPIDWGWVDIGRKISASNHLEIL